MVEISDEWIQKYQEQRKTHYGEEATREEAIEELGRLVKYFELLLKVEERENQKTS